MRQAAVMVVEDEGVIALDLQGELRALGYDVPRVARSGEEALERLQSEHPDAILMDANLGMGMSGIVAAHRIRSLHRIPVIFVTAYSGETPLRSALEAGAEGYLVKPFSTEQLRSAVELALGQRSLQTRHGELNRRFRRPVDSNLIGMTIGTVDGSILHANDAFLAMVGYDRADLEAGRVNWSALSSPKFEAANERAVQTVLATGQAGPWETEYVRKDGSLLPAFVGVTRVDDTSDEYVACVVDLTERKRDQDELAVRFRQQAAVARLGQIALSEESLQSLLDDCVLLICEALQTDHAAVLELVPGGEALWVRAVSEMRDLTSRDHVLVHLSEAYPAAHAIGTGHPTVCEDLHRETRFKPHPNLLRTGATSSLSVPIEGAGGLYGAITTSTDARRTFSENDVFVLQAFSHVLTMAVKRLASAETLRRKQQQQAALARLGQLALEGAPTSALMEAASDQAIEVLGADVAVVMEWDLQRVELIMRAASGTERWPAGQGCPLPVRGSLFRWALEHEETVLVDDYREEARFPIPPPLADERIASSIVAAVAGRHRPFGMLAAHSRTPRRFSEVEVAWMQGAANVLSLHVQRTSAERELQELARDHELILQSAGEGILMLEPGGHISFANPAASRMTGWTVDELLGSDAHQLLHHARADGSPYPEEACPFTATLRDGTCRRMDDEVMWRKEGGCFPVECSATPIVQGGRILGVVMTFDDISARKEAEAALRKSESQLRQSQKMDAVGKLAGGVAHDFNNVLTAITGYTELLLCSLEVQDPRREFVTEIRDAGDRAASLTRQLLTFSRRSLIASRPVDLNAVVSNLEKMLRRLIGEDIELTVALAPVLPRFTADPGQIEQVVMNLVVNARDAMPQGGHLDVGIASVDTGECENCPRGSCVRLSVRDTGCGMREETLKQIFEPFFTTKEPGKGTGLGLSTVYGIVQGCGGCVHVSSTPGDGSELRIYFPALGVAEVPSGSLKTPRPQVPRGRETILVVEDEASVRSLVTLVLGGSGYRVLSASSGADALEICGSHEDRVDLLLTDTVMPGMSGRVVAEQVTAMRPNVRVLYMSGYTDDAVLRHGVEVEGVSFLQKPFSPAQLAGTVREVLDA